MLGVGIKGELRPSPGSWPYSESKKAVVQRDSAFEGRRYYCIMIAVTWERKKINDAKGREGQQLEPL